MVPHRKLLDRYVHSLLSSTQPLWFSHVGIRLPILANDSPSQALLPHAARILDPAGLRYDLRFGETAVGLQGARHASSRHPVAHRVRALISLAFPSWWWFSCPYRGSYILNHTPFGNAVFISMDIPDAFFAVRFLSPLSRVPPSY